MTLKPGVSYCLRRFYTLVEQMARSRWVAHIKANRRNHPILGNADDLEDFLFSSSRQSLAIISTQLRKLDGSRCFYCGEGLADADIDHFVPFSLYSRDLAHNFVLAHPACNRSKSDTLAARPHLERWLERLVLKEQQLAEIGLLAGVSGDKEIVQRIEYVHGHIIGSQPGRQHIVNVFITESISPTVNRLSIAVFFYTCPGLVPYINEGEVPRADHQGHACAHGNGKGGPTCADLPR